MNTARIEKVRTPFSTVMDHLKTFLLIKKADGISHATLESYRHQLMPFLREHPEFLEDPRSAISEFLGSTENEWSRHTRAKHLKVFCAYLVEEGVFPKTPMKGIRVSMPRRKAEMTTREELKKFLRHIDTRNYAGKRLRVMVLLAVDTGLRRGELCGIHIEDLDLPSGLLRVRPETSKVRKGRVVPISPSMGKELARFLARRPEQWSDRPELFLTEEGKRLSPENFGLQVRRAAKSAGVPEFHLHGLRHLCATEFLRETGNLVLTAQLLGHTTVQTTAAFYEHLDLEDLKAAHLQRNSLEGLIPAERVRKA